MKYNTELENVKLTIHKDVSVSIDKTILQRQLGCLGKLIDSLEAELRFAIVTEEVSKQCNQDLQDLKDLHSLIYLIISKDA